MVIIFFLLSKFLLLLLILFFSFVLQTARRTIIIRTSINNFNIIKIRKQLVNWFELITNLKLFVLIKIYYSSQLKIMTF